MSTSRTRWVGLGSAQGGDAATVGADVARTAIAGPDPRLLVVFSSQAYDLPALLAGIRSVAGDTPVVGCSTAGEIATAGPQDAGVVVVAFGGEGFSVATSMARNSSRGLRAAGAQAASALDRLEHREHTVLLLLSDGLAGDQQEIVRGAYEVAGAAVPLVGGSAGDDLAMCATNQFFDDEVLRDAVIGVALSSDAPFGIGVRHGWRTVGEPLVVTSSANAVVHSLNDRPALDVYLERLGAPAAAHTDPAAFTQFAMTHPLGLSRRSGEPQVRFVSGADFETRSIVCIAEVPQGGLAWFMEGDEASVLAATDGACTDALDGLAGQTPLGVLAFDCIARRGVLGDEGIGREIRRIAQHVDSAPVAGFYTYGEIARTRGLAGFHNQTLVVLAVA
jgi:hypothetical protein